MDLLNDTLQYFLETHHNKETEHKDTAKAVKNLCEQEERLLETLNEEQKKMFDQYTEALTKVQWLQQEDIKRLCFVFGAGLTGEVFQVLHQGNK